MSALATKMSWRVLRLSTDKNFPVLLALVILAALLARLSVALLFGNYNPATAELWEYGDIARIYANEGWIARKILGPDGVFYTAPTAYMPPGYMFVWMAAFAVFGVSKAALIAVTALNIACSLLIVWLTAKLAQEATGDTMVALLAAAIVGLYPTFVYSVITYHALNAYTAVFLAALLLIIWQVHAPRMGRLVAIGVLGGAAALARSEFVLFMGVLYVTLWFITRRTKEFVLLTLISAAVVLPWTVRNYVVFDRVIPIASSVGYNLWKGHNPEASGSGDEIEKIGAAKRQLGDVILQVPRDRNYDVAYDQVFRDAALSYIRAHPLETVLMGIKKNVLFWVWEAYDPIAHRPAYLVPHIVTGLLALAGIVLAARQRLNTATVFILAVVLIQSLINAAFSVHVRYRMTVEPLLFIYTALACVAFLKAWWHRGVDAAPAEILELRQPAMRAD